MYNREDAFNALVKKYMQEGVTASDAMLQRCVASGSWMYMTEMCWDLLEQEFPELG